MNRDIFATVSFNAQEYNANKKAAAKADSAAPAAEAAPSKKRKKSEDGGEKKKAAFQCQKIKSRPRLSPFYVPHRKRRSLRRRTRSGGLTP